MPLGIIVNCLSVVIGGIVGKLAGSKLSASFKEQLEMVFGCCAMGMGIASIVLMENMPAVIFAVVVGTMIGLAMHLGELTRKGGRLLQKGIGRILPGAAGPTDDEAFTASLLTVIVLFCASGTGIYGSIVEGMSGDPSILFSKSVLDVFTALIFATSLGLVVSAIALPQLVIFLALFACAKLIFPLTTPAMLNDFKACGGFLLLATGFRMLKLKMFPTADMIPAMVLVMPLSALWTNVVMPMIG